MDFQLFYRLSCNPFRKEEDICLELRDFKEMKVRLEYLKQAKGIGVFTGNPGVGKSYALRKFAASLNENLYQVCYFALSTVSVTEFYRSLSLQLGLEPRFRKIDNFNGIQERLTSLEREQRKTAVLILDEAHYLKSSILQDLTMLMNFEMDSKNRAIVILTGLPCLASNLSRAPLEPFRQRIVTQYQVHGIETSDVTMYIETKLKKAGRTTPLFDDSAVSALAQNCNASMRRLNNLLVHSLVIGATQGKETIDTEVVFSAAQEMNIV